MQAPIKTIETPFGKQKIELKEWITGKDREYIDGSFLSNIDVKTRIQGKDPNMTVDKLDIEKLSNESQHRAIEKFVVSVDGVKENILTLVYDMHEDDTAFILEQIDASSKKKAETQSM